MRRLEESWKTYFDIKRVCCFNYSANAVYGELLDGYSKLDRIHGDINPNVKYSEVQVKLGIDRSMDVCSEHSFLYKDTMPTYSYGIWTEPNKRLIAIGKKLKNGVSKFHPEFFDVDYIVIYGCSLGKSDTAYFRYLFQNANGKKIVLYYYGNTERTSIEDRINSISGYPTNNILFIDDSIDYGYRKDLSQQIQEKWDY